MFPELVRNVVRGSMGPDFSVWNENERKYNEEEASLSKEAPSSFFCLIGIHITLSTRRIS